MDRKTLLRAQLDQLLAAKNQLPSRNPRLEIFQRQLERELELLDTEPPTPQS